MGMPQLNKLSEQIEKEDFFKKWWIKLLYIFAIVVLILLAFHAITLKG